MNSALSDSLIQPLSPADPASAAALFRTQHAGPPGIYHRAVIRALAHVRELLDMPTAFIAEVQAEEFVVRYLDGDTLNGRVAGGTRLRASETVASRVLMSNEPLAVSDLREKKEWAEGVLARDLGARAYVGVPLTLSTGEVYGVLCCFSNRPDARLRRRDAQFLRLIGDLIIESLEHQRADKRHYSRTAALIRETLDSGSLQTAYQPIIDLNSERVVGYEALARFPRPPDWTPDLWFAAARSIGFGVELEVAAIEVALESRPTHPRGNYLALNVSPATLMSPDLRSLLGGLELDDIVFEITEHEAYEVNPAFVARVNDWRSLGARIAIDDAGSGYAGLAQVLHLRPEILKLDRLLVRGAEHDPARQALTFSLAWFARRTGAQVIAEGIETASEVEVMHSLGVGFGQGFHLGRPVGRPPRPL